MVAVQGAVWHIDNGFCGNLFIADTSNSRIREVGLAGFPTLTLANVTTNNAGTYDVVITASGRSVTSAQQFSLCGVGLRPAGCGASGSAGSRKLARRKTADFRPQKIPTFWNHQPY